MAAFFLLKACWSTAPGMYEYIKTLNFCRSILHVTTKIANNVSLDLKSGGGNLVSFAPPPHKIPFPGPLVVF